MPSVSAVASLSSQQFVRNLVLYLVPMILSLSVHEYAHAFVATKFGDDTPMREERLTLSPAAHIDLWGTLLLPALSILTVGYAFIGWAKPVHVNPARFRRGITMRTGMAITAAAGPISNLLLSIVCVATLSVAQRPGLLDGSTSTREAIGQLLFTTALVNVGLCIFNLLPLPPLDGSRLLPARFDSLIEKITPYSFLILAGVLSIPGLRYVLLQWPVQNLSRFIFSLFGTPSPV